MFKIHLGDTPHMVRGKRLVVEIEVCGLAVDRGNAPHTWSLIRRDETVRHAMIPEDANMCMHTCACMVG